MSSGELADRLEVSRRTVYRDLDAFSGAGVLSSPIVAATAARTRLGGYRTDLTGLTGAELEALPAFGGSGLCLCHPIWPASRTRSWSDHRLRLRYRRDLDRVVHRTMERYALVSKAGTWYLLAGVRGQPRVRSAWAAQVGARQRRPHPNACR